MNTKPLWEMLASVSVGTVIAWGVVIVTIISAMCTATIKLYNVFEKTHKIKEENDNFKALVETHTQRLDNFEVTLKEIKAALSEQRDVNLRQIRHEIVNSCELAMRENYITTSSLRSLEEMYEEYKNIFHGNGYVKTLMEKVRNLNVEKNIED